MALMQPFAPIEQGKAPQESITVESIVGSAVTRFLLRSLARRCVLGISSIYSYILLKRKPLLIRYTIYTYNQKTLWTAIVVNVNIAVIYLSEHSAGRLVYIFLLHCTGYWWKYIHLADAFISNWQIRKLKVCLHQQISAWYHGIKLVDALFENGWVNQQAFNKFLPAWSII